MAISHGRREELARAKGFASYREYRRAPAAERERATRALKASGAAGYRGAPAQTTRAKGGRRSIYDTEAGRLVTGSRRDVLGSQLRQGAARGQYLVDGSVTLRLPDGHRRTIDLGQHGGMFPLADVYQGAALATLFAILALMYGGDGFDGAEVESWDVTVGD